jgi:hypothetical protein
MELQGSLSSFGLNTVTGKCSVIYQSFGYLMLYPYDYYDVQHSDGDVVRIRVGSSKKKELLLFTNR